MKISVPATFYAYDKLTYFRDNNREHGFEAYRGAPGSTSEVEVPSFFTEESVEGGNNVCHVQLQNMDVVSSTGVPILFDGTYARDYGSKQVRCMKVVSTSWRCFTIEAYKGLNPNYTSYGFEVYCFQRKDGDPSYYGSAPVRTTFCRSYVDAYKNGRRTQGTIIHQGTAWSRAMSEQLWYDVLAHFSLDWHYDPSSTPIYSDCTDIAEFVYSLVRTFDINVSTRKDMTKWSGICSITLPSKSLQSYLIFDEWDLVHQRVSGKAYAGYHLAALRQEAYLDALDHVPQLNENSLANILELASFIKSVVVDHRVEIPKSLNSAWLSYRYAFNTTKMDAEEAIHFVHRHVDDDFLCKGFSCYGQVTSEFSGTSVIMKCRLDMKQKELTYLDKIWTALYRYGLSPSFYMIWDTIPYSFIVDWFIPVGDILSGYDKTHMYDRTYDITNVWFSISYTVEDNGSFVHSYTRWKSGSPPEFNGFYTLDNKGTTSSKVIGYRILDTMALLFR